MKHKSIEFMDMLVAVAHDSNKDKLMLLLTINNAEYKPQADVQGCYDKIMELKASDGLFKTFCNVAPCSEMVEDAHQSLENSKECTSFCDKVIGRPE